MDIKDSRDYGLPVMTSVLYFAPSPRMSEKYCDQHVCLSYCLSLHLHVSKTTCPYFTKFSEHITLAVA